MSSKEKREEEQKRRGKERKTLRKVAPLFFKVRTIPRFSFTDKAQFCLSRDPSLTISIYFPRQNSNARRPGNDSRQSFVIQTGKREEIRSFEKAIERSKEKKVHECKSRVPKVKRKKARESRER